MPRPDPLVAPDAELWLMDPKAATSRLTDADLAILTPDERRRADRFGTAQRRHDDLCTRILQRRALARYAGVEPAAWRFSIEPGGRPVVECPADRRHLRFSISHTSGLIAILLSSDAEVGVDVEVRSRATDAIGIAERFFAPEEVAALQALAGEPRQIRFLRLWTLKEAALKALGTGLATPLDAVTFDIAEEADTVSATVSPRLSPREAGWHFQSLRPTSDHILGLAILDGSGPERRASVKPRWFQP